ncbi:hypothetical protein [Patulibacter sp.]|uniref:hypothetical protein n=1 Tax=Patulibacter sp. TaxID=1912859 RepID=UPI0027274C6D|nr:hypothetical protein [Patulibacter sp.]MDO9407194.1 hypothetical protein [Patulibacter sp.]
MQPLRLVIVAAAMVAVLALIAGFTSENDQRNRDEASATQSVVAPPPVPSRVVEADLPSTKTVVAQVGQTVQLTVKLDAVDSLVLDAFGLDTTIPAGIATPVLFTAISPGRYDLKLQDSGKVIGRLVVREARPGGSSGGTTPQAEPEQETPGVAEPATAA